MIFDGTVAFYYYYYYYYYNKFKGKANQRNFYILPVNIDILIQ